MTAKPAQLAAATLYLRLKKRISIVPESTVTLGQVARLLPSTGSEHKYKQLELYKHQLQDGNRVVIDVLQVIRALKDLEPELIVEAYGDPQVLVMVENNSSKPRLIILVGVWLLLFFGAGLAIMNFHADVSMMEVHTRIAELLTGRKLEHPLWFQIPYSVGIGLGMIVFFNHIFKKKFNEEPNPLELELYTYQETINAYVIAEEMRRTANNKDGDSHG